MDWQLLALSFVTVFLAELGDKSQLAAIALSGSSKSPIAVFFGTSAALVMASAIGVLVGGSAALVLPTVWVKGTAAAGFGVLGIRLLWPSAGDETEDTLDPHDSDSSAGDPDNTGPEE